MPAKGHHDLQFPKDDLRRIAVWLDCNSDFFGVYENGKDQLEDKVVWPQLE